ncbi:integumentary mucin C.1-like [Anopheles moucheti]|uniref:integumentary mucin C.1-like n=1 Tax=Anopheles moucheti TaxID=186751 RepID=UPI0022F0941F|nr:integumentary mucin C.1-like [Anopheles moucheti]
MLDGVIIDSRRDHHQVSLRVLLCAFVFFSIPPNFLPFVSGASFDGYTYPTPTPTPSFDGYDYTTPSCPLLEQPVPACTASATILTVPVRINVTETIVTYIKQPTTVTTTLIVPTTSTEIHRAVETQTNYHTTTHTERISLPAVTKTSSVTSTITRIETITSPVVRIEYVTERYPVVEYRTDTVTKTSTCTVTELFPTTYYSTYISTSYAPPVTDVSYLTETAYRTLTSTQVNTQFRTQTETSATYLTHTETIRATRTLTETTTVTASCAPPPLNNEYLPVPAPSNDYLPPVSGRQQPAEQRVRSNFVLPEDLLPPKRPPVQDTVSVTVTKTLDPVTLTKEHTVTKVTTAGIANGATSAAVRTKSVIAFDQRVTKLVTITPTLTSYIYMDSVTVTATKPAAALKAG